MDPVKVMIARFPYGGTEEADVCDWVVKTVCEMKADPRIHDEIIPMRVDDTPVTMSRNRVLEKAKKLEIDFLLMIDSDMAPDRHHPDNPYCDRPTSWAKPFWKTSFDFLIHQRERNAPSVIAAPYCGPPPAENIYVFYWANKASDTPADEADVTLEQYSRHEAAEMRGIQKAAALPTGLFLMDMKALSAIHPPYTYYEHDSLVTEKHSTEDVTFTRDMAMLGVPMFCNWDAWAGHWKRKCVGRPNNLGNESVGGKFEEAVLRKYNIGPGEQLIQVEGPTNGQRDPRSIVRDIRPSSVQQHGESELFAGQND